jgi:hypothetical protein
MKKIILCLMVACLSLTLLPIQLNASTVVSTSSPVTAKTTESSEAKVLELRLSEINSMDKSELKASEKKNLRKEVKSMNHRLRELGGGVYLSAGAIVLIVILLIVLL